MHFSVMLAYLPHDLVNAFTFGSNNIMSPYVASQESIIIYQGGNHV